MTMSNGLQACVLGAAVAIVAWAAPAQAQGVFTSTTSRTDVLVFNPATTATAQADAFLVQVLGLLAGTTVYDQTFALPVGDALVQAAFAAAMQAILAQGGPGTSVGAPQLASSTATPSVSSTTLYSLAGENIVIEPGVITFGPAIILRGAITTCDVSSLPSATLPSCVSGGDPFGLGLNDTNVNINTTTTYTIGTLITETTTTTLSQVWTIAGTLPPVVGAVPEPASWALVALGIGMLGAARRKRRRDRGN